MILNKGIELMKLLVLDGNSIVNRAFYGIKLLTTKSGEYTNAIYGFLNILLKLEDICTPDAVAEITVTSVLSQRVTVTRFGLHTAVLRFCLQELKWGRR